MVVTGGVNAQIPIENSHEPNDASTTERALTSADPQVAFVQPLADGPSVANSTGHLELVWDETGGAATTPLSYELQRSRDSAFTAPVTLYEGRDRRTFISGLAEGSYFFRVRTVVSEIEHGQWSDPVGIQVEYVDRWKVYALMCVGLFCLMATVYMIVCGTLRERKANPTIS